MKPLILFITVAVALAQAPTPGGPQTVAVTVTNSLGQYVTDLKQADFTLEENGVPQQLTRFTADVDAPISLGILIDKSTSMRLPVAVQGRERVPAALLAADGAARVIVRLTKPQDEFLFMLFDDTFQVKQSFTTDKKKLTEILNQNNKVGGATRLYHAVGEALREVRKKAKNSKRALVVITDVHDTSGDKIEDLQATIRDLEIPVYTFGMRWDAWGVPGQETEPGKATYEEAVLKMMASESGGYSTIVDIPDLLSDYTINRMIDFVKVIEIELRGQYALTYNSTTPGPSAGKTIRVRAGAPDNRIQVRRESLEKPVGKK